MLSRCRSAAGEISPVDAVQRADTIAQFDAEPPPRWVAPETRVEQVEPCLRLWHAAIILLIEDALMHAAGSQSKWVGTPQVRAEAFEDLTTLGPITRRFARLCGVDPADVRDAFFRRLKEQEREPRQAA